MLKLLLCALLYVAADAATTATMPSDMTTTDMDMMTTMAPDMMTTTAMAAKILYDMKHHKAMIVRDDGCYEYHMNNQDVLDHANNSTREAMEARILTSLANAVNIQETGRHHIDHMTQEIVQACDAVPVYSFD